MRCPKCGFEQKRAPECARCGVIFAKLAEARRRQAEGRQPEPEPEPATPASEPGAPPAWIPRFGPRKAALRDACKSLARLFTSGVGLHEALLSLSMGARGALRRLLEDLSHRLAEGESMADAMAHHGRVFSPSDIAMMRAAERIGHQGEAFLAIASGIEARLEVRGQIVRGLAYPIVLCVLSFFLLPIPRLILEGTEAYVREVVTGFATLLAIAAIPAFLIPFLLRQTPLGKGLKQAAWFLPWPASLYRLWVRATFTRIAAQSLGAGVEVFESLETAARTTTDPRFILRIQAVAQRIEAGSNLALAIGAERLLEQGDLMLLTSGEKSGGMAEALQTLAESYQERFDNALRIFLMVLNVVLTLALLIYTAIQVMSALKKATGGVHDAMKLIEDQMPYRPISK